MIENTVSGKLDNPEGKPSSIAYKRPTSERKKKILANSACGKGLAFQDLYKLKNSKKIIISYSILRVINLNRHFSRKGIHK